MSTLKPTINAQRNVLSWMITIGFPLVVFGIFLLFHDLNPFVIFTTMFQSVFSDMYGFGEVVIKTTPFILTALATALPARAGMINVGGEGQLAVGALFTTFAAVFLLSDAPMFVGIPLLILIGAIGGALWSGIAATLKVRAGMNETITTLLLNYVAFYLVGYFVHGILKDPDSFNWPYSPPLSESLRLPSLFDSRINIGIVIALVLAAVVWYVTKKTRWGFRVRIVGNNPLAALRSGLNVNKIQLIVLLLGGALAGLAGMIEVAGVEGRLRPSTGVDYGYLGFLAAWMARNNPIGSVLTAFILGILAVSGNSLEITSGLPSSAIHILMALVLISILAKRRREKA